MIPSFWWPTRNIWTLLKFSRTDLVSIILIFDDFCMICQSAEVVWQILYKFDHFIRMWRHWVCQNVPLVNDFFLLMSVEIWSWLCLQRMWCLYRDFSGHVVMICHPLARIVVPFVLCFHHCHFAYIGISSWVGCIYCQVVCAMVIYIRRYLVSPIYLTIIMFFCAKRSIRVQFCIIRCWWCKGGFVDGYRWFLLEFGW